MDRPLKNPQFLSKVDRKKAKELLDEHKQRSKYYYKGMKTYAERLDKEQKLEDNIRRGMLFVFPKKSKKNPIMGINSGRVEEKRKELKGKFKDEDDFKIKFSRWLEDEGYVGRQIGPAPIERMIAELHLDEIAKKGSTRVKRF